MHAPLQSCGSITRGFSWIDRTLLKIEHCCLVVYFSENNINYSEKWHVTKGIVEQNHLSSQENPQPFQINPHLSFDDNAPYVFLYIFCCIHLNLFLCPIMCYYFSNTAQFNQEKLTFNHKKCVSIGWSKKIKTREIFISSVRFRNLVAKKTFFSNKIDCHSIHRRKPWRLKSLQFRKKNRPEHYNFRENYSLEMYKSMN